MRKCFQQKAKKIMKTMKYYMFFIDYKINGLNYQIQMLTSTIDPTLSEMNKITEFPLTSCGFDLFLDPITEQ